MGRNHPAHPFDGGAVLIHTVLALGALVAFSAFVIDFGVYLTAKNQAQNAADAGALAGAVAIAADGDPATDGGDAEEEARSVATLNPVFGRLPVLDAADVSFPLVAPCTVAEPCIRVDIVRSAARANALPMFFGRLIGLTEQDVRATATAQVRIGNASPCLRPIAVPDEFIDNDGDGEFSAGDTYVEPGYTLSDVGTELPLYGGPHSLPRVAPGWFRLIDLDAVQAGGANDTEEAMRRCVGNPYSIGGIPLLPQQGGEVGKVRSGAIDLVDLDPNAYWDNAARKVVNSCVDDRPVSCWRYDEHNDLVPDPTATLSPRVIALPIFDPEAQWAGGGGNGPLELVNILGFFLCTDVAGHACTSPGGGGGGGGRGRGGGGGGQGGAGGGAVELRGVVVTRLESAVGPGGPAGNASFLKVVSLIR